MMIFFFACYAFALFCFAVCVRRDDWANAAFWLVLLIIFAVGAGGSLETFNG